MDQGVDAAVREGAKSLFETAMSHMVQHYQEGNHEKGYKIFEVLLKAYCDSVDSNGKMLARIHELERG